MDVRKSKLNIVVSLCFKIITMIMAILVRKVLIKTCGNEVNGLYALYSSIIGFLSVVELGIGSAITFCMYKPIVEKDNDKVSALYQLFHKIYLTIGVIILGIGLAITPFIKYLAKDYASLDVNFYSTFILMLISVVITYYFGAKTSLINAYKNNYLTTAISSSGMLLQHFLQIAILYWIKSFEWYLVCKIISSFVQGVVTEIIVRKKYLPILKNKQKVDSNTKKVLTRSIRAMFMHKIGAVLVTTVDSIIISFYLGVSILGKYSNYMAVMSALTALLSVIFTSITSVLGHLYYKADKVITKNYCELIHYFNFSLGMLFFLGYYAIIDYLIAVFFGVELIVDKSIPFVITINTFVTFLRQSVLVFKDATGTFYHDRWKPLFEGISNLVLSILLVNYIGVVGVIVATILTNLIVCHVVEPYVLYKNAFEISPKKYYIRNYSMIIIFIVGLLLTDHLMINNGKLIEEVLINGALSVVISIAISFFTLLFNAEAKRYVLHKLKKNQGR